MPELNDLMPDLPPGQLTSAILYEHAQAIWERADRLPAHEARAWREDAEHIRDAAARLAALEGAHHG